MPSRTSVLHLPSIASDTPPGWSWDRLDAVCQGVVDCPHSTPKLDDDGPLMVRSQDMRSGMFRTEDAARVSEVTYRERIERAKPSYGDLVYSREGTYFGIAAEVPPNTRVCLGQRMVLLQPDTEKVHFRFLRYWLNSSIMERFIYGYRDGSVAERLNMSTIRALPVPTPPLDEQRSIAHILGTLDEKIELNRQTNQTLEAIARAIFKSWFIDFDPVHAKAAGQQPPGLDPEIASLFPNSFSDSPMGLIPEGWQAHDLPQALKVNPLRRLSKGQISPYLSMANMPTDSALPQNWELREYGSGMRFVNGDVLVARITPCLENGKTAFVSFLEDGEVGWGSTEYIVLRSKPPLPLEYPYFLARTAQFRSYAISNMTGTSGRQRVPKACFDQYHVVVPPKEVAHRFGQIAEATMRKIRQSAEESRTLAQLRDTLLPKLISGDLRVPEPETPITEADRC